jgi:transposase
MKTLITPDLSTINALADRLKKAKGRPEFQRIQCVLIRATLDSSAAEIARLLGWSTETVHVIHSRWAKEGDAIFNLKAKGGRRNQYLPAEEEAAFLKPFLLKAEAGGILNAMEIKAAFEAKVGKVVAKSTVYRMLERCGWRKIAPRPRHPKADLAAQAAFKKTRNGNSRRG